VVGSGGGQWWWAAAHEPHPRDRRTHPCAVVDRGPARVRDLFASKALHLDVRVLVPDVPAAGGAHGFDLICNAQRCVSTRPSHAPASSRHVECTCIPIIPKPSTPVPSVPRRPHGPMGAGSAWRLDGGRMAADACPATLPAAGGPGHRGRLGRGRMPAERAVGRRDRNGERKLD
jgi:hypothetical protein